MTCLGNAAGRSSAASGSSAGMADAGSGVGCCDCACESVSGLGSADAGCRDCGCRDTSRRCPAKSLLKQVQREILHPRAHTADMLIIVID